MSDVPPEIAADALPRHVAIVMDGNGRWAQQRGRPRGFGHRAGAKTVRRIVTDCRRRGIPALTLFAFSQENWQRPAAEVALLMELFARTLGRETRRLHENGIRVRFIGDHRDFAPSLKKAMDAAEALTAANRGMTLFLAVGYGGQWDILQAAKQVISAGEPLDATTLAARLSTAEAADVDLMIRTGGEQRISNFLLWQLSYAELYFSPVLWPDFDESAFATALQWFASRQRRFGRVPEAA